MRDNDYFYRCHNCGYGTTFSVFLKRVDQHQYNDWVMEKFKNKGKREISKPQATKPEFEQVFRSEYQELECISDMADDHPAKAYIIGRKIPPNRYRDIYFAQDFKKFMDLNFPTHGKELIDDEARIVLFYKNEKGYVTHVCGRSLGVSNLRYMTIHVSTVDRKTFGVEYMDNNKLVYVTEGQFDSMFLENGVAAGDSSLYNLGEHLMNKLFVKDLVLVGDNEPRNKEITSQLKKSIEYGFKVVIWPATIRSKDINQMVLDGMTKEHVKHIIDRNTYKGLEALLQFNSWRKT